MTVSTTMRYAFCIPKTFDYAYLDSYVLSFWLTLMLYSLVDDLAFNSDQQFCPILQLSNLSQILMDNLDLISEDQY